MSLLPKVLAKIQSLELGSHDRCVLEFLRDNAVGHSNAKPGEQIVAYLHTRGHASTKNKIQNGIVNESRSEESDFFIGSCHRGFFVIDTHDDFKVMDEFYRVRIASEETHRDNLRRQASGSDLDVGPNEKRLRQLLAEQAV